MKRKAVWTLGVLFLMAALLAVSVPAKAEMYLEGYLGGALASGLSNSTTFNYPTIPTYHENASLTGNTKATVIGGMKLGTWFVPTGFLGYSYPDWMKYFGFYTDFSFQALKVRNAQGHSTDNFTPSTTYPIDFNSDGTVATWAFMFAARYGFLQDNEVPFGRLQPYVAVGPAVMFTTVRPKVYYTTLGGGFTDSQSSTNIALAVDAGLRYMVLQNVSIDLSFKYRWANPNYTITSNDSSWSPTPQPVTAKYEPTLNLFSFQLGAAYHF